MKISLLMVNLHPATDAHLNLCTDSTDVPVLHLEDADRDGESHTLSIQFASMRQLVAVRDRINEFLENPSEEWDEEEGGEESREADAAQVP